MMMSARMAQLGAGLLVAMTPWIVVHIALAAANRQVLAVGQPVPRIGPIVLLGRATAMAALVVAGFAVSLPARSATMAVIDGVVFVGLSAMAISALRDLDKATQAARHVDSASRAASLVARRRHHYLPSYWRLLPFGVTIAGLALFAWRITIPPSGDRRLFVPTAFALISTVYLWLYETWIHNVVTGPTVPDAGDVNAARRRSVRRVFAIEVILVTGLLALAHVLLDLDWTLTAAWAAIASVAGGVLGVIGCAFALSSDLSSRRYRVIR
jgi:hypothetical protein